MLISELPAGLIDLALKRQIECTDYFSSKNTENLARAFRWDKTIEGHKFWNNLNNGNFEEWFEIQRKELAKTDDLIYSFGEWLIENCEIYDGVVGYESEEYSLEGIIAVYKQEIADDNIETTP